MQSFNQKKRYSINGLRGGYSNFNVTSNAMAGGPSFGTDDQQQNTDNQGRLQFYRVRKNFNKFGMRGRNNFTVRNAGIVGGRFNLIRPLGTSQYARKYRNRNASFTRGFFQRGFVVKNRQGFRQFQPNQGGRQGGRAKIGLMNGVQKVMPNVFLQGSGQVLGLEDAIRNSRRDAVWIQRRGGFNAGNAFRGGQNNMNAYGWRRGGGRRRGRRGNQFMGNSSKDALDAQLDSYMGEEAVKGRLDQDLDAYFGREEHMPSKPLDENQDISMEGY